MQGQADRASRTVAAARALDTVATTFAVAGYVFAAGLAALLLGDHGTGDASGLEALGLGLGLAFFFIVLTFMGVLCAAGAACAFGWRLVRYRVLALRSATPVLVLPLVGLGLWAVLVLRTADDGGAVPQYDMPAVVPPSAPASAPPSSVDG